MLTRQPLKILQWNAAYLYKDKLHEFRNDLNNINPAVVMLCETNWKNEYRVKFTSYNVFCLNRQGQRGGGVAILVKKSIPANVLSLPQLPNLEVIGVTLKLRNQNLDVVSVYCPHGDSCGEDEIQQLFEATGENAVVAGDFNAYSQLWTSNPHMNQAGKAIEAYLETNDKFSCTTPYNLKTRRNTNNNCISYSTIDLTFTTTNLAGSTLTYTGPEDWLSDHHPICSEIALCPIAQPATPLHWWFDTKKWGTWNSDLQLELRNKDFDIITNPAAAFEAFYTSIISVSQKHFQPRPNMIRRESTKPWWNKTCQQAVSRARKARRAWLKNPSNVRLKTELNFHEATKKKVLLRASRQSWAAHIESLEKTKDTKKFWNFVNIMNNKKSPLPNVPINDPNGGTTTDSGRKADIFLNHYFPENVAPHESDERADHLQRVVEDLCHDDQPHALNDDFTLDELNEALKDLPSKAMGKDRIHNEMLTNMSMENRKCLLRLLNLSYSTGFVPPEWKIAIVVPILKAGKPANEAVSYRPISLTSCLAKLKEKMINKRLKWYLERNGYIPKWQAGFRSGYTTMDHVVQLENTVNTAFNNGHIVSAVFLDLSEAYDMTWTMGLLYKTSKLGIKGKLLLWLKNFLIGRMAQVRIDDSTSGLRTLAMGVPQGGVLSPTLFIIYLYDFPPPRRGINLSLFADDITFYVVADKTEDATVTLQVYIYDIEFWAEEWKMSFSIGKNASLTFSRRTQYEDQVRLTITNDPIGTVESFKLLGVHFNRRLTWKTHIDCLSRAAARSGHIIYSLTYMKPSLGLNLLIRTYKALIRSLLDYGAPVLVAARKSHTRKIEVIQNRFTRTMLGAFKSTSISLLTMETGISKVKDRWEFLAASYYVKLSRRYANPAYDSVRKTLALQHCWKPCSTPAVVLLAPILRSLDPNIFTPAPAARPNYSPRPPWRKAHIAFGFFPMSKKRALASPLEAKLLFLELTKAEEAHHLSLYTDGSVDPDQHHAACSLHIPKLNVNYSWSLNRFTNILTSELYAINKALIHLTHSNFSEGTIFTDSLSALQSIQVPKQNNGLVMETLNIVQTCAAHNIRVNLIWIPSHVGIPGNEKADKLASDGLESPINGTINNPLTAQEIIGPYRQTWKEALRLTLIQSSTNQAVTSRRTLGPLPWHTHYERSLQTTLFRLRSGHNKLRGCVGLWSPEGDIFCQKGCQTKEDTDHVLLYCSHYATQRSKLRAVFTSINQQFTVPSILGLNSEIPDSSQFKIRDALCKFIRESDLLGKI